MHGENHKEGFTLIEIVVVIAILAILALIAIPKISGYTEKARINADKANLNTLNKATMMYATSNNKCGEDIFAEVTSDEDEDRMEILVGGGFLNEIIEPQQKEKKFIWNKDGQIWTMGSLDGTGLEDPEEAEDPDPDMTEDQATAAGFIFEKIGETYTITGYDVDIGGSNVEIPSKIGGLPVTKIGSKSFAAEQSFFGTYWPRSSITSVVIPDTVEEIGDNAFRYGNLTSIDIPDSVKKIGAKAFRGNYITEVTIKGSSIEIGEEAFWNNLWIVNFSNIPSENSQGTWIPGGYFGLSNWIKKE